MRAWFAISLQTFGGPAGQIAVMQRTLVDEKRWIGQRRFLHAMNYCMLLPGPEAQQLATYVGWLLHGTRGGLVAGGLFVLPGVVALLVLSAVYVAFGSTTAVTALFAGLAPAVLAIVAQAVVRVGKRALTARRWSHRRRLLPGARAVRVPFPVVVLAPAPPAGRCTVVAGRCPGGAGRGGGRRSAAGHPGRRPAHRAALAPADLRVLLTGLLVWGLPVAAVALLTGAGSVFTQQGLFFSGAAVVTFGGAYAVLAYVAQQAVQVYGWLAPGEMVRGLALAETTPGPLIMVVQFVAFLGAYRDPGALDPWVAAVLASLLVTWVTFVPSFLFVLLGAPYMERLRGNRSLSAALTGITAAVVGVIANLGVDFAVHTLFADMSPVGTALARTPRPDVAPAGGARHRRGRRGPALPPPLVGAPHPRRVRAPRPGGRSRRPPGALTSHQSIR